MANPADGTSRLVFTATWVSSRLSFSASACSIQQPLANRVRFENPELVRDCLQATPGRALILSSHHANWEWLLLRCSSEFNEPLTAAYKPTRRESVDGVLRACASVSAAPW